MSQNTSTVQDVVTFVTESATNEDIAKIYAAAKIRSQVLRAQRAAAVSVGDTATTTNLSPKYLNGLRGTVATGTAGGGSRYDLILDEASTVTLRFAGRRFYVPADVTNYRLAGVPASSLSVEA